MRHKLLSAALALTMALSLFSSASAAEVQRHEVPVTLTVIQTEQRISVTVPAALPVSVVDDYVVTATNAAIRNTADSGTVRVSAVAVTDGALTVGSYENFPAGAYSTMRISLPVRTAPSLYPSTAALPRTAGPWLSPKPPFRIFRLGAVWLWTTRPRLPRKGI